MAVDIWTSRRLVVRGVVEEASIFDSASLRVREGAQQRRVSVERYPRTILTMEVRRVELEAASASAMSLAREVRDVRGM